MTDAFATSAPIDPRVAFLLVAATHHELVERGGEDIEQAFANVVAWFDHMFPPEPPCCEICGCVSCVHPSFCRECRCADEKRRSRR